MDTLIISVGAHDHKLFVIPRSELKEYGEALEWVRRAVEQDTEREFPYNASFLLGESVNTLPMDDQFIEKARLRYEFLTNLGVCMAPWEKFYVELSRTIVIAIVLREWYRIKNVHSADADFEEYYEDLVSEANDRHRTIFRFLRRHYKNEQKSTEAPQQQQQEQENVETTSAPQASEDAEKSLVEGDADMEDCSSESEDEEDVEDSWNEKRVSLKLCVQDSNLIAKFGKCPPHEVDIIEIISEYDGCELFEICEVECEEYDEEVTDVPGETQEKKVGIEEMAGEDRIEEGVMDDKDDKNEENEESDGQGKDKDGSRPLFYWEKFLCPNFSNIQASGQILQIPIYY